MPAFDVDLRGDRWTYGSEWELADWNSLKPQSLPEGYGRSGDHTIVNSNGIAAQPNPKVYRYGGEVNTPPTTLPEQQSFKDFLGRHPTAQVNHRSNLHIHIRVPGLKDSLKYLKQVQRYIHEELPKVIRLVEPIPKGVTSAEKKRERRRKVSHQTFLSKPRVVHQLKALTLKDFYEREVPRSKTSQVMWHAQPRVCVNLRQLLQTDTVEFRHFPGTLDDIGLLICIEWCRGFLLCAFEEAPIESLWARFSRRPFPKFPPFNEEREVRYQATAAKSGLPPEEIKTNIDLILKGKFNAQDSPEAYRKAQERAGVVSW